MKNKIVLLALLSLMACKDKINENKNENFEYIVYASQTSGDASSDGPSMDRVYDMCIFTSELDNVSLVIGRIKFMSLDSRTICDGGEYKTYPAFYELKIDKLIGGLEVEDSIVLIDINEAIVLNRFKEQEYGLFLIKKDQSNYFVLNSVKFASHGYEPQGEEYQSTYDLPDNAEGLVLAYQDFSAHREERCTEIPRPSEEEWERFTYGDPADCPVPDGSVEPCREDNPNPPACCYDDTAPIECCSSFPPENCL